MKTDDRLAAVRHVPCHLAIVFGLTPKGASVVQYGEKCDVPYHGDDQGLECNEDAIPSVGTAVRVSFRVHAHALAPMAPAASAVGPVAQEPTSPNGKP